MRTIKFRAWDGKNMLHDIDVSFNGCMMHDNYEYPTYPLMQFTGLLDKNGKEIYEGDQLRVCAGYSSTVEFQDGMFVSVYRHPEDAETIPLCDVIGKETEVIGNIYQKH